MELKGLLKKSGKCDLDLLQRLDWEDSSDISASKKGR